MGKQQLRLLKFALRFPGWHTCSADSRPAMRALESKGLLEVADHGRKAAPQFRVALPDYAHKGISAMRDALPDAEHAAAVGREAR